MLLLRVEGVRKQYGPEPVLAGVSIDLHSGQRLGLVGPNGAGKTTLLRILAGREEPDAGSIARAGSIRVGYLEQQAAGTGERTLWDEARSGLEELFALQQEALAVARALSATTDPGEHRRLAARYDALQHELHCRDAYNLDHKIERVLQGLGFAEKNYQRRVAELSGGEQNRLLLAKLLLADPEVLLLDEPSNHLDMEATEWLEEFLATSRAAMIVVSHDRYFLDKVTTETLELYQGMVERFSGSFSAYWRQKAERLLVQRRAYEKQQQQIAKAEEFIRRYHFGERHAQAEDRRKKLQRMVRVAPPREIAAPAMGFPPARRSGDVVLRVEGLAKGYDRPLFRDVEFTILRGQRWGILGPNGSGKTTLVRCALGLERPDAGRATLGQAVEVGYFDQHLSGLEDGLPVAEAIRSAHPQQDEPFRRSVLARFGLVGEAALQPVGSLSGGQRCRAALARLACAAANFLVLDEPTNHLDLWARDALERSLLEFDGTVLFVSHDRYFVNRVADHLLVFEGDRVRVVEGNYDTYLHLVRSEAKPMPAGEADKKAVPSRTGRPGGEKTGLGAAAAGPRKRRFPYRKTEEIEAEILERESRIEELHALLARPETHRDGQQARRLKAEIAREQEILQTLYAHWEEAVELNW